MSSWICDATRQHVCPGLGIRLLGEPMPAYRLSELEGPEGKCDFNSTHFLSRCMLLGMLLGILNIGCNGYYTPLKNPFLFAGFT